MASRRFCENGSLVFEVLGPLTLGDGPDRCVVTPRKVEILLAALLARAGRVVASGDLGTEIWGGRPPRRADATLHVYVSQLRKLLARFGAHACAVETLAPGYALRLGTARTDLRTFEELMRKGRDEARGGAFETAIELLEKALSLWRGPALGNLRDGPIVSGFAMHCEELRLECLEIAMEAKLALGRHREIIGPLYAVVAEYPLQEAFRRQLMLALYRAERQADALRVYQSARDVLREELGLEPGRPLQELQRAILLSDDRL